MFRISQLLCPMLGAGLVYGQITQLDLHFQTKDVDFSSANATKPFKSGTTLPSVCGVGEMFFKQDAAAGANLYGCTSLNTWTLEQTSSAGPGAGMASQLGDFAVVRTSATALSIGANCSAATPCNVRFGSVLYSFSGGATVSISGGTGMAYIYVASTGALTVGHNLTASCSGACVLQSGVTSFPADAIPLFTWSATNGTWDVAGGADQRALLSSKSIIASTGLTGVESSGKTVIAVDSNVVGLKTSAPATSSSACTMGSWATDSSYYYLCVSANSWRRAALSTW